MKSKLKQFFVVTLMFFTISYCTQQGLEPGPSYLKDPQYETDKSMLNKNVAKSLASIIKQKEVRKFVKSNVVNQFDGDYNFLFTLEKDKSISIENEAGRVSINTFGELLSKNFTTSSIVGRSSSSDFESLVSSLNPLMEIKIPELNGISPEDWDTENTTPIVAALASNMRDAEYIIGYDSEGNEYEIDLNKEPDQLVIIIGENERVIGIKNEDVVSGKVNAICEPLFVEQGVSYVLKETYYNECQEPFPRPGDVINDPAGDPPAPVCDRDSKNTMDKINRIKFRNMTIYRDAEKWANGKFELRVIIVIGNIANSQLATVEKFYTEDRNDLKNCSWLGTSCDTVWRTLNTNIITWNEASYGNLMTYTWLEEDSGTSTTYSINSSTSYTDPSGTTSSVTGSVSVTITDEDYKIGGAWVEYCNNTDGNGFDYDTGRMYFSINQ